MNDSYLPAPPLFDGVPLTVVDVETTGLDPSRDRVVEIALLRVVGGAIERQFATLVNPERDIPYEAQAVHGITPEMVRHQPPFREIVEEVATFVGDGPLVGHNVAFDLGFLRAEFRRAGVLLPDLPTIDTLRLSRQYLRLSSHRLAVVARSLGLRASNHRALNDARLTLAVFTRLVEEFDVVVSADGIVQPDRSRVRAPTIARGSGYGPFRAGQRLFLRYQSPTSGLSERVVDVLEIVVDREVVSLYAFCHRSQDMRSFRTDRIVAWYELDEDAVPDASSEIADPR